MLIIHSYRLERKPYTKNFFYVRSSETLSCPICNGKLTVSGSRYRKMIDEDGSDIKLIIRRMKCQGCGKLHQEAALAGPDFDIQRFVGEGLPTAFPLRRVLDDIGALRHYVFCFWYVS